MHTHIYCFGLGEAVFYKLFYINYLIVILQIIIILFHDENKNL